MHNDEHTLMQLLMEGDKIVPTVFGNDSCKIRRNEKPPAVEPDEYR